MLNDLTIEELQCQLAGLKSVYVGQKIQHVTSSGWYKIVSIHYRESNMAIEFLYETLDRDPIAFSRPITELFDGRFRLS